MKISEILSKPLKVKGGGAVNLKGLSKHIVDKEVGGDYELPIASAETLGGIKVGENLSINPETGILSATGGAGTMIINVRKEGEDLFPITPPDFDTIREFVLKGGIIVAHHSNNNAYYPMCFARDISASILSLEFVHDLDGVLQFLYMTIEAEPEE